MSVQAKQLNQVPGGVACRTAGTLSGAHNDAADSTGYASHAEGERSVSGPPLIDSVIVPGGTLVTVAYDVRQYFNTGDPVVIIRKTPTLYPVLAGKTIVGPVVFAAGNTTFNISSALDPSTNTIAIASSNGAIGGWGRASHAEGEVCFSLGGSGSHAEGSFCKAFGYGAHAEGAATVAQGNESHSEGETTRARGIDAHAEGGSCIAQGFCSHAEGGAGTGNATIAAGTSSHSEGALTRTGNIPVNYTCAAGGTAISIAGNHAAEFLNGAQIGFCPDVPNLGLTVYQVITSVPVFAAGFTTFSIGLPIDNWSTGGTCADGDNFGWAAHAEGHTTVALGKGSHAEGVQNLAQAEASHSEGKQTQATGVSSHAEGAVTIASGLASHAEGNTTTASGQGAHSEGGAALASGLYSHAEGYQCTASQTYSHAEGQSCTASGNSSHAEGQGNTASAVGAHAEGGLTTASGAYSHAQGISCTASGSCSSASGQGAKAANENEDCFAGTMFSAIGDAQFRRLVIKGSTPGALAGETVVLKSGGSTAVFTTASKSYMAKLRGIATKMGLGAAARQSFAFEYDFAVDCDSTNALTISALTPIVAILAGAAFVGATVTVVAAGAGSLAPTFTIAGGLTIASRIVGYIELVEVLGT